MDHGWRSRLEEQPIIESCWLWLALAKTEDDDKHTQHPHPHSISIQRQPPISSTFLPMTTTTSEAATDSKYRASYKLFYNNRWDRKQTCVTEWVIRLRTKRKRRTRLIVEGCMVVMSDGIWIHHRQQIKQHFAFV
jgi:hypothetical protein